MWARASNYANSHSSEQGTLLTAPLISKQDVPYQAHGGSCYPGVSTPKIQSLADSSMLIHISWRIPIDSTIPTHAQPTALILTMVNSHLDDGRPTPSILIQAKLNIIKMKDLYDSQDCTAKQLYPNTNPNPKGISRYSIYGMHTIV
jgi:hypothetical protein